MRDQGLLDSALARPSNQFIYDPNADIATLAAAYGFGSAKNHAFVGTSASHSSQPHFFCG
jgi:death on curing protein